MRSVRWMVGLAVLAFGLAMESPVAQAQWAIYGQGTGGSLRYTEPALIYGGTLGFYHVKQERLFEYGPDFRGSIVKSGNVNGPYTDHMLATGQFGIRVAAHPRGWYVKPYLEGTVGVGYWRAGTGLARLDDMHFLMQVIGGADYRITNRLDWRVAEVTYGRVGSQPGFIHPITISTGIVIHLP